MQALLPELFVVATVHGAVCRGVHRDVALRHLCQVRPRPGRPLVLLRLHGRQERSVQRSPFNGSTDNGSTQLLVQFVPD